MRKRTETRPLGFRCPVDLEEWLDATFENRTKGIVASLQYARKNGLMLLSQPVARKRAVRAAGMTP